MTATITQSIIPFVIDDLANSVVLTDDSDSSSADNWVVINADSSEKNKPLDTNHSEPEHASETLAAVAEHTSATNEHAVIEQPTSWFSAITNQLNVFCNATLDVAKKAIGNSTPDVPQQEITLADKNTQDAKELVFKVRDKLEHLDACVFRITGNHVLEVDTGRIDAVQLSTWDSLQNFSSRTQGAVTALFDTTIKVASGTVAGGVASTGILGVGLGAAALGGGTIVAARSLRQLPQNANNQAVFNEIDRLLPDIAKDLQALDTIISQEQYRQQVGQRIMATMAMRYDLCIAMNQTINSLEQESNARVLRYAELAAAPKSDDETADETAQNQSMPPQVSAQTIQQNDSIRGVLQQHVEHARDALHALIASLVQAFNAISERIALISQTRQATAETNAERHAEEAFKKTYATMLLDLADSKGSRLDSGAHVIALQSIKNGNSSTKATSATLLANMRTGENITRAILSSDTNFGAIKYTAYAGEKKSDYAVPSNLTTVRSIANYIDGQAISNAKNPAIADTTTAISKNQDGSYTIADPDHKLYNFLAGAPTARLNFVQIDQDTSANLIDHGIGRMAIVDYSGTFPGGAHQMVFEPQADETGANVLVMRFTEPDQQPVGTHYQTVTSNIIGAMHEKQVLQEKSEITLDFSHMSRAEIWEKLDNIALACKHQQQLLEEDNRQMAALNQWANPLYLKQA